MGLSRREFTGGAFGLALGSRLAAPALAEGPGTYSAALAAIGSYAEAHARHFDLPGMTLGLTSADGFTTVLNFGHANADAQTPIGPDTLFEIGSITKEMVAALLHQFAAEGRLKLTDRVSDLLPAAPLPPGNSIQVQHLLDHTAGLPTDAPLFAAGGLWTGYAPGAHWHYSNTGYELLGLLAEHVGGKPLSSLLAERIFNPLGMKKSRGAIVGTDRTLYAQGYEAADMSVPFARGVPLAPAAWVDVTQGAGCVASTASDMNLFLRSLADAVQGRGGLGLSPALARTLTTHAVPSDMSGMTYGNGIMHVSGGGRAYLHHTGGMVAFSSSYHVDIASGTGAFASATLSAFADYRPRMLTRFAVDALTNARAGLPLPVRPALEMPLVNAGQYAGRYSGPEGSFQIAAGSPLLIVAGTGTAPLQQWGNDLFRTQHPNVRRYSLKFERTNGVVTGASWGPAAFVKEGSNATLPRSDPAVARLAGRYVNDSPWWGVMPIVERGGRLWLGTETPLTRIGENLWRVGEESWSPDRASFDDLIDGRPQVLVLSGERFARHEL